MLDSLVRVSRRAACDHYASILAEARTSVGAGRMTPWAITLPEESYIPGAFFRPPQLMLAWLPPRARGTGPPMDGGSQVWLQALPFQQFHVLFDSLSKVLFIFRSLYLCAIGLWPVFSFRRNIPPI
jgi:hypothetical protein